MIAADKSLIPQKVLFPLEKDSSLSGLASFDALQKEVSALFIFDLERLKADDYPRKRGK